ncbi:hypothetical protein YQE_09197, partial [Dendroctonus ponderosae]
MVHPTELLRTDSTGDEGSFIAPVGDYRNDVDCGCSVLPCLTQRLNLEKYAKPTFFVGVLSFAGFFSGIALKYFRGTSQIWSQHYNIPQDTIAWLSVAVLLLLTGCLIAMFPKVMPSTLLRKSVNSLLSIASGNAVIESRGSVDGFFTSLGRILRNRVLLLNIVAMTCMQAAIINFSIQEKFFNQSKYHVSKYNDVSGYSDPMLIQFSTNLLKQPLVAVAYICVGIIIAKMNPTPKLLIMWNILVFGIVLVTFAAIRFFSCTTELHNELAGALTIPYCSWHCGCSLDGPFQPICLNGETHFSPCWAGCSSFDSSLKIYENCTCAGESRRVASEGSCDADSCSTLWALAQAHGVVSSALLGTTFITTLIINLRCIARKDKALALGLHMTCISLIPYLPIRAIYDVIAGRVFSVAFAADSCIFLAIFVKCGESPHVNSIQTSLQYL